MQQVWRGCVKNLDGPAHSPKRQRITSHALRRPDYKLNFNRIAGVNQDPLPSGLGYISVNVRAPGIAPLLLILLDAPGDKVSTGND